LQDYLEKHGEKNIEFLKLGRLYWQFLPFVLKHVVANRSKTTVKLNEICRLCFCSR